VSTVGSVQVLLVRLGREFRSNLSGCLCNASKEMGKVSLSNQAVCEQHHPFDSAILVISSSLFTMYKSDVKDQSTFAASFLRLTQQG